MSETRKAADILNKDDLIVVTGAGGFIGGSLIRYFSDQGFTQLHYDD